MKDLPEWAKREESYRPDKDRDAFISRSLLRMMEMLKVLRAQAGRRGRRSPCSFSCCSLS